MQVTATQAKNRFGAMCAHAKTEPVFVEKDGQIDTVIVSAKQFSELQAAHRIEPLSQRKAQFEQSHSAWLAEQNQRFETHGLWCAPNDASLAAIAEADQLIKSRRSRFATADELMNGLEKASRK
jgi:PHD/YefM family antitoxin component YafN of YafNO toxin-antitoxin module